MSNPAIITQFGLADPNANPLTLNELIQLLNTLVASNITPEYPDPSHPTFRLFYVVSPDEPGADDHDKLWVQLEPTTLKPVAIKMWWRGNWRRVYNGMLGEVRGFTGTPGYGDPPALFSETGLGNIGLEYDGWALCNGRNGTPDLSDKFLLGAHMNKHDSHPAYKDGRWVAFIPGEGTDPGEEKSDGGAFRQMIQPVNLPALDNGLPDPVTGVQEPSGLYVHGNEIQDDFGAEHSDAHVIISRFYKSGSADPTKRHSEKLITYGCRPNDNPPQPQRELPITPPYYALAWITFVGY